MDDLPERALAALEKYGGWYGVLRALDDAERYRWLRANKNRTREGTHMNPAFCGVTFYHYSPVIVAGPNLDEAIDAAMRGQGANDALSRADVNPQSNKNSDSASA